MNLQQLRDSGWIIFEAISGSHAYGTNVEGSDLDIRGVYIQPTGSMLGLTNYIPQISDEKNDITFYEIGRFLELASKGNPNIMELFNMPEEQITYKRPIWDSLFTSEVKARFITAKLKKSFTGFAYAQIKKARGLNKKIAWEKNRVKRKYISDFCYVLWNDDLKNPEDSMSLNFFLRVGGGEPDNIGLAKVNNAPDLYSMYYLGENGGMFKENSNDVQLRSIPKGSKFLGYLRFDKNGYSQHCKDYREYQEWLENRNEERYNNNQRHGKGYDSKNLMHTYRLLYMARDIAQGKGIVVRRPEAELLLSIRRGDYSYDQLVEQAGHIVEEIKEEFDKIDLPKEVSMKWLNMFLTTIRIDDFMDRNVKTIQGEVIVI